MKSFHLKVASIYHNHTNLKIGSSMMVDDGLLEFTVLESGDGFVRAEANNTGFLGERKGVNLPG